MSMSHSATQNGLLAALHPGEYDRMLPNLELVPMPLGWIVHDAGRSQQYVYFPTTAVVSLQCVSEAGASSVVAVTGNEGMVGMAALMGGDKTVNRAVVHSAGYAYRLQAGFIKKEFESGSPLHQSLLRYARTLMSQMAQTAACNRYHTVEQRYCRWLLSILDRIGASDLFATHEFIAEVLSVRREGITEIAGKLQIAGTIHSSRGHIVVIDRLGMESRACECYGVIKGELERLLPKPYVEEFSF